MQALQQTADLVQADREHLLHPVAPLYELEKTGPFIIAEGHGIFVRDNDGKEYVDGMSALWNVNVGHGRKSIAEAAAAQMSKLAFAPSFWGMANPPSIQLAARLAELTPEGLKRFFFTSGGAESNETAFKLARYYFRMQGQDKYKIIARHGGYHGISLGALSATGVPSYHDKFGPTCPGFLHIPAPYCYGCAFDKVYPQCEIDCAAELERAILREGPETVAAFIAEPVQGVGGVIVPPPEYFPKIEAICKKYDVLFIADEVITGFGRTGKWFGVQNWNVHPDMISFAKGVTSGYLPLGGVALTERIYEGIKRPDTVFMHGFTYNGHPSCCAAALANLDILVGEDLPGNAARVGKYLQDRFQEFYRYEFVGNVRGIGLLAAVELVANRETKTKFAHSLKVGAQVAAAARANGLICRAIGDVLVFAPPLIITRPQVDMLVDRFATALESVQKSLPV
ncbi:MAG: aspartate aminotransferase family protein [Chloroflexi bacterium]|nr:aspartate aminotransferase family protein [Chloroflexota bacterium]MCL5025344.1 aspartate aminotransferase family protein [Chloroflexota bacterium]